MTLAPFGFECAIAIDEDCTEISVAVSCKAKAYDFTGVASVNNKVGTAPIHQSSEGISHIINFAIDDLLNCNLRAEIEVKQQNETLVTRELNPDQL